MAQTILFNTSQSMAITHGPGPALVIAGPGSGKTAVIIARIRYLIHKLNISPENILVLTFTRKAAGEMRTRFAADNSEKVAFGTFHSVFWQILKQETDLKEAAILREWEQRIIIRRCLMKIGEMGYSRLSAGVIRTMTDEEVDDYLSVVSRLCESRNESSHPNIFDNTYPDSCRNNRADSCIISPGTMEKHMRTRPMVTKSMRTTIKGYHNDLMPEKYLLYKLYTREKRDLNRVDYDDMAVRCRELFIENEGILKKWQDKYRYILVDEFQDINLSQYRVLELLGSCRHGAEGNIFVVGDDDQSIYGFRGSDPSYMTGFMWDHEGARQYVLDTNYRCGSEIIALGNRLIDCNTNRISKRILAGRNEKGRVSFYRSEYVNDEGQIILKHILELRKGGMRYSDMAVLTRTNRDLRRIESLLTLNGIPCMGAAGGHTWRSQEIVRDLAAYIALALGPVRRNDFIRVMNKPLRYLDRNCLEEELLNWEELIHDYNGPEYSKTAGNEIMRMKWEVNNIRNLSPEMVLPYLIRVVGYDRRNEELEARIRQEAKGYNDLRSFLEHLVNDQDDNGSMGVMLTTYHGSKGLEFKAVFLPMLVEGTVPSPNAITDKQIEEERRMFYVAITRARDHLIMSCPQIAGGKIKTPSRFLKEIGEPAELM